MKKAIAIITVVLVTLLVAATIILAVVPKNFYDPISEYDYKKIQFIRVYNGEGQCEEFYRNDTSQSEVYNKILELHEESLSEKVLGAMFQGALSFDGSIKTEAVTDDTFNENLKTKTYIEIKYIDEVEMTLKYDGKAYKDNESEPVTFNKIIIEVNSSDYMEEVRAFIVNQDTKQYFPASTYNVRFLAHQSELYKYIQSLELTGTVAGK